MQSAWDSCPAGLRMRGCGGVTESIIWPIVRLGLKRKYLFLHNL